MIVNQEMAGRVVVIDNYDSFTFNLVQYLGKSGCNPLVFRNDEIQLGDLERLKPSMLLISPGPGKPSCSRYFGLSFRALQEISPQIPTLGVCLGHQGIAAAYGGDIRRADTLYHGKTTEIHHDRRGIFSGIPDPFSAARYHSLIVAPESLPDRLQVSARGPEGEIMGLRHRDYPIYGVQFHPESILTEYGRELLNNFYRLAGGDLR